MCRSTWNMCRPCCCHVAPALMKVGRATAAMYFFACFLSLTASSVASTCSSLCSSLPASVVYHGWRANLQFTEFPRLCLGLPCLSLILLVLSVSACLCSTVLSTRQAGRSPLNCCCLLPLLFEEAKPLPGTALHPSSSPQYPAIVRVLSALSFPFPLRARGFAYPGCAGCAACVRAPSR